MGSSNKRAVNVDLMLDFMVNLRTSLVSLELDWGNENLVLRRSKKASSQLHRSRMSPNFNTMYNTFTHCCGSVCFWASRIRILLSSTKISKINLDFYCSLTFIFEK
jgi:hypothetical protein